MRKRTMHEAGGPRWKLAEHLDRAGFAVHPDDIIIPLGGQRQQDLFRWSCAAIRKSDGFQVSIDSWHTVSLCARYGVWVELDRGGIRTSFIYDATALIPGMYCSWEPRPEDE